MKNRRILGGKVHSRIECEATTPRNQDEDRYNDYAPPMYFNHCSSQWEVES
ncbi:hypothetical protein GCM10008985_30760 [Halococcus dombrowskii]|uniref:Uncharacterized protein n=1 Tax=Halococcus dombrowskii TaxID=179637 RepID=A0AAV3SKG4_HALDO